MSGKTYLRDQQFFKPNYYEAIKYILPSYLYEDDIQTTPKDSDPVDLIINSHISIANNISSVLPISSIPDTIYSSLASFNGISPFFVKQNNLTNITTKTFEDKVLYYFNKTFNDFSTSSELSSYLESTILPGIALNNPDTSVFADIGESSAIQVYLVNELSWMYMLNTTGVYYDPSSYIRDEIVSKLYNATPFRIDDGIKGLVEHVWRNDLTDYYPTSLFASSSEYHLSGTQQLEKLKTWVEVIYSPLYADRSDFTVKDRFDIFYDNSTTYVNKIESGPFARLIRALSFFAFDINNETEQISTLYDIDDCPDDYLPLIAQLIGWDLFGNDPARWRLQLRSAIPVYKAIGTKEATQRAINTIFPRGVFPIEGRLTELWESYIPYLIYYALATESEYFKDYSTWTSELANGMGVTRYSSTSMDENIKLAVDRIIYETVYQFPSSFNTEFWPEKFNYRSRDYPIPPFEEYPYYANVELNNEMIRFMTDRLVCFGVNQDFALDVSSYLYNNSLNTDDQPRRGSWLLFTSGYNEPSNLSSLITNINDKRFEYVSLWSGKSSHFKLVLDASEFDFANTGFNNTATKDAVTVVSKAVRNSAPAHSIPLISLEVSGDSDVLSLSHDMLPSVWVDKVEIDNGATNNYYSKALNLNSYKRSVNESGTVIGRNATANSVTPEILNGTYETANLGRKTLRRRSYEKIMPFNGYYDRTGFNMPAGYGVGFDTLSSTHTLGLIPSSLQFVPVSSHIDLPPIWSQCETLGSRNYYYEYPVSGTFPARDRRKKHLIIMAGQSNINGRGLGDKDPVSGVNYWDLETSSFTDQIKPKENTYVGVYPGNPSAPGYPSDPQYWGPEVRFAELLVNSDFNKDDVYIFKFASDNSLVVDATSSTLGNLWTQFGDGEKGATWCPSSTNSNTIWSKFSSQLDLVLDALGGPSLVSDVTLLWNQGETEAGRGQDADSIAYQHSGATSFLIDTIRNKFSTLTTFNPVRVKIHQDFSTNSESDWRYYPNGKWELTGVWDASASGTLGYILDFVYGANASTPGSYGGWAWSSTNTVRAGQEALNSSLYGQLVNLDDLTLSAQEPSLISNYISATGYFLDGNNPPPVVAGTISILTELLTGVPGIFTTNASAILYDIPRVFNLSPSTASGVEFVHSAIHYTDDAIDSQGERLYSVWSSIAADRNEERVTRGSLPGIYAAMHRVKEKQKYLQAYLDYDLSSVETSGDLVSYANAMQNFGTSAPGLSATYSSSSVINNLFAFPTSHHSYYDFEFSRDIHRLYHIYKNNFQWHRLSQDVREMDGANIFSHAFGPTLYNHSFEEFGTNFEKIVASSIGSVNELTWDNDYFVSIGSYEATSVDDMIVGSPELVSSGILSGVELVHTSGSNEDSSFALFRVPSNVRTRDEDPYMFDKTFIMMRSGFNAIPRIRFDISKYQEPSNHPISNNFLIPDMGYKFSFDYVISRDSGNILGGRAAKVWIHTKPELGKMWSYTPSKAWVQHDASVTREDVLSRYSHTKLYPQRNIAGRPSDPTNLQCLQEVRAQFKSPVSNLKEEYFDTFTVEFNTDNRELVLPRQYQSTYNQLHRIDQEYVIEILLTPRIDSDQYLLLDKVNLQNTTLKKLTEIFASGKVSNPLCRLSYPSRECTEYRVELTKEDLFEILKHFNNITGKNSVLGYASRDATETEAIMGSSGGSKLDYRLLLEGLSTSIPNVFGTDIPTMFSEVLVDI